MHGEEYPWGGISIARSGLVFGFVFCMLVGSSGAGRFPAFPCACPASGAPRGCTTSVTSADGAPGAQLGAELWPLDSPVSAGSAQGLQGHRNSARSSVRSSHNHPELFHCSSRTAIQAFFAVKPNTACPDLCRALHLT